MHAEPSIDRIQRKVVWGRRVKLAAALACALVVPSCSDTIRTGQGSSYLVITTLAGKDGVPVHSDVVSDTGGIIDDVGTADFTLQMKDVLNTPSANNAITLTQYQVEYIRSDGHNVQGVDVPFAFSGGLNLTISGTGSTGFTIVRVQAKLEAPLKALRGLGGNVVISTVARVTFYGHDQTGREVTVTGNIDVNFADWAG